MSHYHHREYLSDDGLRLFARDYTAAADAPVVLCLHGLTRNSADFEPLCNALAGRYRLIVPDQRGRGRSQWDNNPERYQPLRYNHDMLTLLAALEIDRVHIIGTSMGGIMGMMLAAKHPDLIASLVLNDIGPQIDPEGVKLIAKAVARPVQYTDWEDAVTRIKQYHAPLFAEFTDKDWQVFARRTCKAVGQGVGQSVVPDYDPDIGLFFAGASEVAAPDLWDEFRQLHAIPMLVIRGALSNVLSAATCEQMHSQHPKLSVLELANRGHAPLLDEAPALRAIETLLASNTTE